MRYYEDCPETIVGIENKTSKLIEWARKILFPGEHYCLIGTKLLSEEDVAELRAAFLADSNQYNSSSREFRDAVNDLRTIKSDEYDEIRKDRE